MPAGWHEGRIRSQALFGDGSWVLADDLAADSVVDENLRVIGTQRLYVCDMSVIPLSSAANPVRTLVALALRLSQHVG